MVQLDRIVNTGLRKCFWLSYTSHGWFRPHRLAVFLNPLRTARDLRAQRLEERPRAGREVRLPARSDEHLIDERVRQPCHGRRLRELVREARVALRPQFLRQ